MSDRPQGSDWWEGPDGRWYPPESRPDGGDGSARPGPSAGRRPADAHRTTTLAAAGALLASAVTAALAAVAFAAESGSFDAEAAAAAGDPIAALGAASIPMTLWSVAAAAGVVLLIIWMFRSYRLAEQRGPTGTTWSAGWAIGGWLIPLAGIVIPKLVMNEIDRLSNPASGPDPIGDRWKGLPTQMLGHWWWALTIASTVVVVLGLGTVAEQIDSFTLVEQTYRAGLQASGAGLALWAAGAACGAALVWRIGRRLSPRWPGLPGPASE